MSVQRYGIPTTFGSNNDPDGPWVLYADHVAALAEAEQRGYDRGMRPGEPGRAWQTGFNAGRAEALGKAREAVAALLGKTVPPSDGVTEALAAIDAIYALKGES